MGTVLQFGLSIAHHATHKNFLALHKIITGKDY